MDDDFNTPQALGVLFDLARLLYAARDRVAGGSAGAGDVVAGVGELRTLARVLGLLEGPGREEGALESELRVQVEALMEQRQAARSRRDFAEADRLRAALTRLGVLVEDKPGGTTWKLRQ